MNILLTGTTGFLGHNIANALRALGHDVRAASRANGINFQTMTDAQDWLPHLQGVDAVINAVGIIGEVRQQRFATVHTAAPSALFQAAAQRGIRRVIQISALGADASAFSAYHHSKRAADDVLRGLDLDWFVLRPSLVYGKGGDSTRMFLKMASLPVLSVVGAGQQEVQPVHVRDVVATVVQALQAPTTKLTLDLAGPQRFTFEEWLQQMRLAQGLQRTRLVLHTPVALALAATWPLRYVSAVMQPDNIRMLLAGSVADTGPMAQFLGRPPLPFAPHLLFEDAT
jgi:uncharacterized protein YbjT (DUF2867 family)